jgi:hypothetical protein
MEHVDLIALGDPMGWTDAEKMTRMISLLPMLDTRDFIIVDVPASNFTGLIPAVEAASALFAIVTPERVANGDALCCIHELDRHVRETSINIVVNRVTSPDLAEVICGRLEHDCGKILRVRSQCVACLPEIALPPKDEPIRLPMVNSSPDSLFFRLMSRIAQGLSRSAGKNRGADRLQLLLEGLFRAFPEDTFLWLPDARELAFEPSSGLEKEISLLRELVAGARDNGEIGALDLADLCRLIRQAVEPAAKERASLGVPTAS